VFSYKIRSFVGRDIRDRHRLEASVSGLLRRLAQENYLKWAKLLSRGWAEVKNIIYGFPVFGIEQASRCECEGATALKNGAVARKLFRFFIQSVRDDGTRRRSGRTAARGRIRRACRSGRARTFSKSGNRSKLLDALSLTPRLNPTFLSPAPKITNV